MTELTQRSAAVTSSGFMSRVYAWMGFGLAVTAIVSFATVTTPSILEFVFKTPGVFMGLMIAELAMVIGFTFLSNRVSFQIAALLFIGYAAMNGLTLSVIFLAYTASSVASTFAITAGMYITMSFYGATTKRDLTGAGSFAMMGLFGIIIASVVNMFIHSDATSWLISFCGVIVFTLLTAYDTQRIKQLGNFSQNAALIFALTLYLNFINLFLSMLRLFGKRR